MDKVTLRLVFVWELWFFPVCIIWLMLHTHLLIYAPVLCDLCKWHCC